METKKAESSSKKRVKLEVEEKKEVKMDQVGAQQVLVVPFGSREVVQSPKTTPELIPEMWERIFRYLPMEDLINILNSTPEWNQLLASKKTTILLPKVLPLIMDYFDASSLLATRVVSKISNQLVNSALQSYWLSPEEAFKIHFENSTRVGTFHSEIESISDNYVFSAKPDVEKFVNSLKLKHDPNQNQSGSDPKIPRNPFLTSNISIDIDTPMSPQEEELHQQDFRSLQLLLSNYGHHIQRLNCTIWDIMSETQGILKLISYLSFVPNVKILELTAESLTGEEIELGTLPALPNLDKLEYLDLSDMMADTVASHFIQKYAEQLNTFVCEGTWLKTTGLDEASLQNLLPNLKRLRVEGVYCSTLSKLSDVHWPIEVLHFDTFEIEEHNENEETLEQLLLKTIRNFSQSLTQLELYADLTKFEAELQPEVAEPSPSTSSSSAKIQELDSGILMPNLKTLISEVANMGSPWFWGFILGKCKNLKEIHFNTKSADFREPIEVAKHAFEELPDLTKVYFWFDPDNDEDEVHRAVLTRAYHN